MDPHSENNPEKDMSAQYEVRTVTKRLAFDSRSRFYVGHVDDNGEWWDADPDGFETSEEAEAFLEYIESDSVTM